MKGVRAKLKEMTFVRLTNEAGRVLIVAYFSVEPASVSVANEVKEPKLLGRDTRFESSAMRNHFKLFARDPLEKVSGTEGILQEYMSR